ncbi:YibE/F family protein [Clostridium sp. D2Q-14]|uniref:YibE/F family protein n=1 Tax=Anaeromonas gelatinilytica TaxID=2683194 RepID=UPI00193B0871|nr:YibE/F family protein [Anaeromonas gelatinilytica]MBS4536291.1 YibE/F family protein [Anaeromonas gelatinilytica]
MVKKTISIMIIFILISNVIWASSNDDQIKAKVISVINNYSKEESEINNQLIEAKILEGNHKNEVITIKRSVDKYSLYGFMLKEGDTVLVELHLDNNSLSGNIVDIWRVNHLKTLGIIFLVSLVIFGRLKGILSLTALIFSGLIIVKFLIPSVLKGYDAVFISIISAILISVVSFILIAGFTRKTLIAILGTIGGTITAGVLSHIYINLTRITGLADEDVMFMVSNLGIKLDYKGLYMGAIIIGTIGVVMDVSMSITSSIFEIKSQSPNIKFIYLFESGLKIGKDVMSTMVNTLVLAYVGSFMPLLIIYLSSDSNFLYSINTELLAVEIIRSLCGSIGLIFTIPLTCFIAAYSVHNNKNIKKYR